MSRARARRSEAGRDEAASGWPALGADLLELVASLRLERPVAGAASMGVATTLHAAVRAPDRFAGMVLLIPPTAWETRKLQADLYRGGAALEIPALVIATRDDPGHPLATAERLVELLPNAELVVLRDLREAAAQRDTLLRFLARASQSASASGAPRSPGSPYSA